MDDATTVDSMVLRRTSRGPIVGSSAALKNVLAAADRIARASCTVLVTGETGTGKETLVAAIHDGSKVGQGPLVTVNCGAIPEALLEAELFGHAKGAFTGAHASREGRVAAAEGGTLFLDEIGEMPLALQVKLLRLLQQREYAPVGDSRTRRANIRVVAATNRDLAAEVRAGRFREDLFYRLNVIQLHLPALRERPEDIECLALYFFEMRSAELGRDDLLGIAPEAMDLLRARPWSGNVRELENTIERAVLLGTETYLSPKDLACPASPQGAADHREAPALPNDGVDLRAAVDAYETTLIRQALARTGGNKNRAAQLLGLNRTTLVEMIKRKRLAA